MNGPWTLVIRNLWKEKSNHKGIFRRMSVCTPTPTDPELITSYTRVSSLKHIIRTIRLICNFYVRINLYLASE